MASIYIVNGECGDGWRGDAARCFPRPRRLVPSVGCQVRSYCDVIGSESGQPLAKNLSAFSAAKRKEVPRLAEALFPRVSDKEGTRRSAELVQPFAFVGAASGEELGNSGHDGRM